MSAKKPQINQLPNLPGSQGQQSLIYMQKSFNQQQQQSQQQQQQQQSQQQLNQPSQQQQSHFSNIVHPNNPPIQKSNYTNQLYYPYF